MFHTAKSSGQSPEVGGKAESLDNGTVKVEGRQHSPAVLCRNVTSAETSDNTRTGIIGSLHLLSNAQADRATDASLPEIQQI